MKIKKYKKTSSGFTLIELLVVVAILGLIASLIMVSISSAKIKARDVQRIVEISQIQKGLDIYFLNHNEYPQVKDGNLVSGWSKLIDYLRGDGILSSQSNDNYFSMKRYFFGYLIPEVAGAFISICPNNLRPQDPLCECKTPGQEVLVPIQHTYGYMSSSGQNWQYYKLRTQLEDINHHILQTGLTGDFLSVGDNGCNPAQGYYCVGNAEFVPD